MIHTKNLLPKNEEISKIQDRELVVLLIGGSQAAFGELYARYRERLIYFCKQYMNETDAEDIVHNVFLQLWEKRHSMGTISCIY